jgi:predicted MPP superfamily phosphohydrolase
MKVQYVSDLHVEFHKDCGRSLVNELEPVGDVLVLAGDIVCWAQPDAALVFFDKLVDKFSGIPIIYVLGNHEYYRCGSLVVHRHVSKLVDDNTNFHWLCRGNKVNINGVEFIGDTLWFRRPNPLEEIHSFNMSDFTQIPNFCSWVYDHNTLARKWINKHAANNVVVTHHIPSYRLVTEPYVGHILNPFFVCDMKKAFAQNPLAWIFGHTHQDSQALVGNTYCYCNPFGYPHQPTKLADWNRKFFVV